MLCVITAFTVSNNNSRLHCKSKGSSVYASGQRTFSYSIFLEHYLTVLFLMCLMSLEDKTRYNYTKNQIRRHRCLSKVANKNKKIIISPFLCSHSMQIIRTIIIKTRIPIIDPNKPSLHKHSHFLSPMKKERESPFQKRYT